MNIDDLLRVVVERKASDLHLKTGSPPVLRIHGALTPYGDSRITPEEMEEALEHLTTEKQRKSFVEEMELDFAYSISGLARFRVNAARQRGTISLVFRQVNWNIPPLEDLGLPEVCKMLVMKPDGLLLVTGPTGSGKSTTLAAMLDYLNERQARRVVTVEDPIEYLFRDKKCFITQRELGADTQSFSAALKRVLRQDPDVILVGEMRDLETISTALTAAETGHLVFATLHTPSAPGAIDRIIDVFPPYQQAQIRSQLSITLQGVLYQALIPKAGGNGRVPAVEIMIATTAIRNLIREGKTYQMPNIIQTGAQYGMQTLNQALRDLVRGNLITPEDAFIKSDNPDELREWIEGGRSRR
ncbi:MAG: type IV pilus twitching motility protein PilT [Anaerolineales bacterium]|nr:type IV pilus twitching motility protein PilT [Anaerolineales bacterium]